MPAQPLRVAIQAAALLAVMLATGSGAAFGQAGEPRPVVEGPMDPAVAKAVFATGLTAYEAGAYGEAMDAWLPLARSGDPAAQRNLGHLYRYGLGVDQDFETAAAWYRRAAEAGLARAQANLAMMYLRGQGVPEDGVEAARWFAAAALQDHAVAQYNLALLYLRGQGVERNEAKALGWFYRAARSGYRPAAEALAALVPALSGPYGPPAPPEEADSAEHSNASRPVKTTPAAPEAAAGKDETLAKALQQRQTLPARQDPPAETLAGKPKDTSVWTWLKETLDIHEDDDFPSDRGLAPQRPSGE